MLLNAFIRQQVQRTGATRGSSYCCADNAVPGPLQLVVVGRQELAVAHLQVHDGIPQLGHIHPWSAPRHLHQVAGLGDKVLTRTDIQPGRCRNMQELCSTAAWHARHAVHRARHLCDRCRCQVALLHNPAFSCLLC